MFTPEWRERTAVQLMQEAQDDPRISGGAVTGSASEGRLDNWSDIDLAFGIKDASELPKVLDAFTTKMYATYGAVHHLDVNSGAWIYRVFLLSNTLQVDLAFVSESQFGARASTFKLVFGKTSSIAQDPAPPFAVYVGWCWLCALHARASLKRERFWQAEFFVSGMRDYLVSIMCRRFGLPEKQGRGVDRLPLEELERLNSTLATSIALCELKRAFSVTATLCLDEIRQGDAKLYAQVSSTLMELSRG